MTSILKKIAAVKREEVNLAKKNLPLNSLKNRDFLAIRSFREALKGHNPAIIAEIKKASPSKGVIRADFDVAKIAEIYERHGASCLSVLTDKHFFQGDASYIAEAKAHALLPVLRKDFIIDAYQVHESRALGADCILLIVALLDDIQLQDYCQIAAALGMDILVESHNLEEVQRALYLPTPLIGINNRSLHSFKTDLQISIELAKILPPDKIIITESGIHNKKDIQMMQEAGIKHFLIGESLMGSQNIGQKLDELLS